MALYICQLSDVNNDFGPMGLICQGLVKFFCLVKVDSQAKEHSSLGEFVQHQL